MLVMSSRNGAHYSCSPRTKRFINWSRKISTPSWIYSSRRIFTMSPSGETCFFFFQKFYNKNGISFQPFLTCRVAKSQQYDIEGLVEIFRHYGDHLYAKGNHSGAMEQYLKTVGHLEPSYVIKRVRTSHWEAIDFILIHV